MHWYMHCMGRSCTTWQTTHSMQNSEWNRLLQFPSKPNPLLHLHLPHLSHLLHLHLTLQVILCHFKLTLVTIFLLLFFQIQEVATLTQTLHGVLMRQIMRKKVRQYILLFYGVIFILPLDHIQVHFQLGFWLVLFFLPLELSAGWSAASAAVAKCSGLTIQVTTF